MSPCLSKVYRRLPRDSSSYGDIFEKINASMKILGVNSRLRSFVNMLADELQIGSGIKHIISSYNTKGNNFVLAIS